MFEPARAAERPVILLVEDHPDTQDLYHLILRNAGYDVLIANDGEEALRLVQRTTPAAVLLDIGLPKIDGIAVCRRIRNQTRYSSLPVIAVSAWIDRGPAGDSVAATDFTELLAKPIRPDVLLETVRRWVPRGAAVDRGKGRLPRGAGQASLP
jgi:CheY-like chemotaxis protein